MMHVIFIHLDSLIYSCQKHKWKSQWNEVTAKDYCEGYLRKTPPGQLCSQIASVNMEAEIRTCIEDIQVGYIAKIYR